MPLVLDGTNGVSGVDGTASNPAIEGTDSNTGIFYPAADTVAIGTGGTERLRVDSAGNAGLGVTPSAWATSGTILKALQIGAAGSVAAGTVDPSIHTSQNAYFDGTSWRYIQTAAAGNYYISGNSHVWRIAPSGTAGNPITFTQAMTLDASGNLMVGATSNGGGRVEVKQAATNESGIWVYSSATDSNGRFYCDNSAVGIAASYSSTGSYLPIVFRTSATERARITSGGTVGINTISPDAATVLTIQARSGENGMAVKAGTNGNYGIYFNNTSNSTVGGIIINSGSVAYNTTVSDYRLKENITPLVGGLDSISALNPVSFTWKNSGESDIGFIAHELKLVIPQAVTGEKDEVDAEANPKYQSVFPAPAQMIATLVKAIQELNAKVEAQAAEIAALKGNA